MHPEENLCEPAPGGTLVAAEVLGKYGERKSLAFVNVEAFLDVAVGTRLRVFRRQKGMSRGDLANRVGTSVETIRTAETRPWETPIGLIASLCDALGREIYELSEDIAAEFESESDL
jgi:ribosome-binding protein aMBF1 (putative translation factor)